MIEQSYFNNQDLNDEFLYKSSSDQLNSFETTNLKSKKYQLNF